MTQLHVLGGVDASLTNHGFMVLGDVSGNNLVIDNNELIARNNGVPTNLYLNALGGNVGIGTMFIPVNKLDLEGNMAIGAAYAELHTAPANGLIIEGDVGIGTNSPDTKLHLVGADVDASVTTGTLKMTAGGTTMYLDGNEIDVAGGNKLYLNGNGTGDVSIASGTGGGNVGIGTFTPGNKLHVKSVDPTILDHVLLGQYSALAGANKNIAAVAGFNIVDDGFGLGVYGFGGSIGVRGSVLPTGVLFILEY